MSNDFNFSTHFSGPNDSNLRWQFCIEVKSTRFVSISLKSFRSCQHSCRNPLSIFQCFKFIILDTYLFILVSTVIHMNSNRCSSFLGHTELRSLLPWLLKSSVTVLVLTLLLLLLLVLLSFGLLSSWSLSSCLCPYLRRWRDDSAYIESINPAAFNKKSSAVNLVRSFSSLSLESMWAPPLSSLLSPLFSQDISAEKSISKSSSTREESSEVVRKNCNRMIWVTDERKDRRK